MTWTPERISMLRELWPDWSITAEEIGRRLGGLSRHQVIPKAHRMGLPGRPHHGGRPELRPLAGDKRAEVVAMLLTGRGATSTARFCDVTEYSVRKIVEEMLRNGTVRAPASTKRVEFPVKAADEMMIRSSYQTVFDLIVVERPKPMSVLPAWRSRPIPRAKACCWVEEVERKRMWTYCDDPTIAGSSYCQHHHDIAYVRQEMAA